MIVYSYGLHEENQTPLVTAPKISLLSLAHCTKKSFFLGIATVTCSAK